MTVIGLATADLFYRFGAALIIGALVGLQREFAHSGDEYELFAGVRTFALLGMLGCAAATIATFLAAPWVLIGFVLAVGALLAAAYIITVRQGDVGLTTEMAALITFCCGVFCSWGDLVLAAALGVATTVLLSFKLELHAFAHRLTHTDVYATLTFAVMTVIILPLLPRQPLGPPPFDVLQPFAIWFMVTLISGVSFLGYVLFKIVGPQRGTGLTGLLGGLVSSTAVTLSFTQRSRTEPAASYASALAITVAWAVMFVRVGIIIATVNIALLRDLWAPLSGAAIGGVVYAAYLFVRQPTTTDHAVLLANPFELRPALTFGALYAAILLAANVARLSFGSLGIYLSSAAAGVADVDAITLSLATLSSQDSTVPVPTAAQAVLLAILSNTLIKGGVVLAGGSAALRRAILPALALTLGGGGLGALAIQAVL